MITWLSDVTSQTRVPRPVYLCKYPRSRTTNTNLVVGARPRHRLLPRAHALGSARSRGVVGGGLGRGQGGDGAGESQKRKKDRKKATTPPSATRRPRAATAWQLLYGGAPWRVVWARARPPSSDRWTGTLAAAPGWRATPAPIDCRDAGGHGGVSPCGAMAEGIGRVPTGAAALSPPPVRGGATARPWCVPAGDLKGGETPSLHGATRRRRRARLGRDHAVVRLGGLVTRTAPFPRDAVVLQARCGRIPTLRRHPPPSSPSTHPRRSGCATPTAVS